MLLVIAEVGDRLARQADDITSLWNIILEGFWGFDVFVGRCERCIGKLSLKGRRVGSSKMSLPGLVEHPVSTGCFFLMQGGIHLFLPGAMDHSSIILGYVSRCCGLGFSRCALSVDLANYSTLLSMVPAS